MKIVIPGGTGAVGGVLRRALAGAGHDVVVLSRRPETLEPGIRHTALGRPDPRHVGGRGRRGRRGDQPRRPLGQLPLHRRPPAQMMDSRVDSTRVVGRGDRAGDEPPRVWLQMSTATIYAHRLDAANDEATGVIGGEEPDVPLYWEYSVRIARALGGAPSEAADRRRTRKVALRTAMVMSPDRGGSSTYLLWLSRLGLGGPVAGGGQYVSWIHDDDFVRAVDSPPRARRALRAGQPRRPGAAAAARLHAGPAARRGASAGPPGDDVDGRDRSLGAAHRHRAAAQEPAGRARRGCWRPGSSSSTRPGRGRPPISSLGCARVAEVARRERAPGEAPYAGRRRAGDAGRHPPPTVLAAAGWMMTA